jgi:alpha-tubulin suppressor-like RCC1 family protein
MHRRATLVAAGLAVATLAVGGCNIIAGLNDLKHPCDGVPEGQPCTAEAGGGGSSSSSSSSGVGGAAHCHNGVRDDGETAVDCGGECPPCEDGKGCETGADCQSLSCPSHTCVPARCDDMIKNGDETDVDCGGPSCAPCDNDQGCLKGRDCQSGSCATDTCKPWATAVSVAGSHACAVIRTGGVVCWGDNESGGLGDGSTLSRSAPVHVKGLSGVTAVAAGEGFTCARTKAGAVKCWGDGTNGQLGNGSTISSSIPVAVSGLSSGVVAITAGNYHACAVTAAGSSMSCWGNNTNGGLGNNTTTASSVPVPVSSVGFDVAAVSAGDSFTCDVTTSGGAQCWGQNSEGQLGDNSQTDSHVPVDVVGLPAASSTIACGSRHTCAVTTSGAMCWGDNSSGQLGDGTNVQRLQPVGVSGLDSGAASIVAGHFHSCAITTGGAAKCWGANESGQLGDGSTTDRSTPVPVFGLDTGVAAISMGLEVTCALTTKGAVLCWGDNSSGQLGDGTDMNHLTPVRVVEPP